MDKKINTPCFNIDKSFVSKSTCINKSVQPFSVHDDYQYNKMKLKNHQNDSLFHSQIMDPTEVLKQQITELQRQIKIKELSYESIATAYYQCQTQVDELKEALQISEEKNLLLQKELKAQTEKSQYSQADVIECSEINTLFQHENTQLKLTIVKVQQIYIQQKDAINQLQTENRQLKDQIDLLMVNGEKKDSSKQSLDFIINEMDQTQQPQAKSASTLPPCDRKCSNEKRIQQLSSDLKKLQNQLSEKDQLIAKLTQQNLVILQTQTKMQRCQKQTSLFGTPETLGRKIVPILVKDNSNENFQKLNGCLSDKFCNEPQDSQAPVQFSNKYQLRTSSSSRSVLQNKTKKEVQQMYQKMNQSALFTASIYSTMLDYQNLHQSFIQQGTKGFNQIKQL